MLKQFWLDQNGAIVSIEMVLIVTVAILSLIVGWFEVAAAVNTELNDVSNAIGALSQSFCYSGFCSIDRCKFTFFAGSSFKDRIDDCDLNDSCDLICGFRHGSGEQHHHH